MSYPTCPYCGTEVEDPWEFELTDDGDSTETTCSDCDKDFVVTMHVEISYTTRPLEAEAEAEAEEQE